MHNLSWRNFHLRYFKNKLKYLCLLILLYPIPLSHSEILINFKEFETSEDDALTFNTINICIEGDCYDILQMSGANVSITNGGVPQKGMKTIYVFSQDKQNGHASYEGKDWPIIKTYINLDEFYISPNVSADIKINSKNEVLVNNRPIYQFVDDKDDTDAKGIGLNDSWYALKSNGEKLLINNFSPIYPVPNPIYPIISDPNPFPGPIPDPGPPIPGPGPIPDPKNPGPTLIKNYSPKFTNLISESYVQENELFVYKFDVYDPEGDQVFFILKGEDADLFEISADGRLSFKNSPDYEEPLNKNYDNKYRIKVLINDSLEALQNTTQSTSPEDKSSSADFTVNVSNYDEDIIAFSLTGINGTLSSAPAIDISMEVDSYTNSHEAQLLITKGEQQYWTSQQPLSPSNYVHDYDHRFNLPANAPSGTWEVKQVKLISNDGTYIYSKDLLTSKGYQTSVNLTNPVADEVNPELISIQNLSVSGIDSNTNTNIVISIQANVSDAQNDFSRAAGGLKSPKYDGGGGIVSDWAVLDLQSSPFKADFAWVLDPKTASGTYTIDSLRLYDAAGNRTTHRGTGDDLGSLGGYTITINNPIEDTHTPELTDFKLSGYVDNDSRKILRIETNINNGAAGNAALRRQYVRIQSPNIGNYDSDNFVTQTLGSFDNVAYIKLPRGAPDGVYKVDFFFVVDNALNDNKLTNQELVNAFGESNTKVVFGTSENCPAITSSPNFSANENQNAIGTVTVAPNCTSNSFQLSGDDQAAISINNSGVLTFNSAPDYETKSSYTVDVTVTDTVSNETVSQTLLIAINNLNDNDPVITSSNTFTVNENETYVGTIEATDADGNSISFALSGADQSFFSLGTSSGILSFVTPANFDEQASYSVVVTASDGLNSVDQNISINVNDINAGSPTFTSQDTFTVNENQTGIGSVTATDPDGDTITYQIDSSEISIGLNSGGLTFNAAPDYETKSSYTAIVTASDGTNSSSQNITVSLNNLNDNSPVFYSLEPLADGVSQIKYSEPWTINAYENTTRVAAFYMDDADEPTDPNNFYNCTASTFPEIRTPGTGQVNDAKCFLHIGTTGADYETKSQYTFTVTGTDNVNTPTTSSTVTINILNRNDNAPVFTSGTTFTAAENQTAIGTVTVTDADGNLNPLTFTISGSEISIDSTSGVLTFNSAPDYETKSTYTATVTVNDGTFFPTQTITVNVTDVNEGPGNNAPVAVAASHDLNLLPKDQTAKVIELTATDVDGDSLTYSIVSYPSQGSLGLSGSNVTYQTNSGVDTAQTDTFTFRVFDGAAYSDPATITVNLKTDPLYQHQWHLHNYGQKNFASGPSAAGFDLNVDTVIADGYTGSGVLVSVVDEGLEIAHADLVDNVVPGSWDFGDLDNDPTRPAVDGDHGTSVAGIINSVGWNNVGGRGVAPEASLIGYNWLDHQGGNTQYESWGVSPPGGVVADVYNLSYGQGYEGSFAVGGTIGDEAGGSSTQDALRYGTTNHRNGLGALYIKSTGNAYNQSTSSTTACGEDSTYLSQNGIDLSCTETWLSTVHSLPYMVQVAALGANEVKSSYSTPGPSVWISGFGGEFGYSTDLYSSVSGQKFEGPAIMTTDQSGCTNGYVGANGGQQANLFNDGTGGHPENPNCDYTSNFNGTSSAAPTVAGVVALMLEANPNLTWRDVKHILATTADKFDDNRTTTLSGIPQYEWETNAAGYNFHNWYGFGKIDAAEAISEAASYSSTLGTYFVSQAAIYQNYNTVINDLTIQGFPVQFTAPAGSLNFVEFVRVVVNIDHQEPWTFGLRLTSPEGTQVNILQPYTNLGANPSNVYFPIGVNAFYGEEITGEWTLDIIDYEGDDVTGTLLNWGLIIYGGSNNSTGGSAPVITSSATFSAAENQTDIGTVTATDADGDTISYSVSGNELSINSSSGVLTFDSAPDYETQSTYTATVTASDGTYSTEQNITVNVTDVNEGGGNNAPVAIAASYNLNLLPKDQNLIGFTLSGTDADGDSLTYSIVSNPSQGTVSLSGANVTYQTNSGVATAQTDTFTFKVNDGTADSDSATISVNLKTDPLYQHQWHLHNYGQKNFATGPSAAGFDLNVDTVIANGYTGANVLVSVVDEGLEIGHADLAGNVVAGSWDFGDLDNDPTRPAVDGDHGTSVAGIINSVGWNNIGGRGVAPEASLIGYNWLDWQGGNTEYESWGVNPPGGVVADVYNLSYGVGYTDYFAFPWSDGYEFGTTDTETALIYGTTNHRNGLGGLYIKSSGNDFNTNSVSNGTCGKESSWWQNDGIELSCTETINDSVQSLPFMIQVAALGANEEKSSYSTPGSSVWISGFGGEYGYSSDLYSSVAGQDIEGPAIMTTDQSGCTNGYVGANGGQQANIFNDGTGGYSENPNCDYTSNFNGTSSAAPTVAGVVALMLEANEFLTWRDVKHILATTADKFDDNRTTTLSGIVQYEWETNAAGYNFHNWYGFGKIDAAGAISMAENYSTNFGTFATDFIIQSGNTTPLADFGITNYTGLSAPTSPANFIEFIRVSVNLDHASPWTVGLRLTSPQGTQVNIMQPFTNVGSNPSNLWFGIGVNAFYGEDPTGNWTLEIIDYSEDGTAGTLKGFALVFYGH